MHLQLDRRRLNFNMPGFAARFVIDALEALLAGVPKTGADRV